MVICFSCAATGPTSPAPIAPASASAIVQRALISIPPFAFSAFCLLGFSGRRRRPHVGEAIFWKKLSFWNIHCQVGGHCPAHERPSCPSMRRAPYESSLRTVHARFGGGDQGAFQSRSADPTSVVYEYTTELRRGDCLPRQSASLTFAYATPRCAAIVVARSISGSRADR